MLTLTILKSGWRPWLLSCESQSPKWPWTNCGRDKLWLVGCLGCEPRLAETQRVCVYNQALRWGRRACGRGVRAVPRLCIYTLAFDLQQTKSTVNLSQGIRRALGWTGPNAIRLVDLAIAGDGLDWPAGPCRPWISPQAMGSTLGQLKYLPSCRTRGFPTSANVESKLAVRALMWSANGSTPRSSCVCLLLTYQGAPVARRRHLDCRMVLQVHAIFFIRSAGSVLSSVIGQNKLWLPSWRS
jgi:hypothetical protein